jgi:hypothetical protein
MFMIRKSRERDSYPDKRRKLRLTKEMVQAGCDALESLTWEDEHCRGLNSDDETIVRTIFKVMIAVAQPQIDRIHDGKSRG